MATWYAKDLGDGMTATTPMDEIKQVFLRYFHAGGEPLEMAIFTRLDPTGGLHCEMTAYFSPGASEVAKAVGAGPCERPVRMGLSLLAGDVHCWSILFPEGD